jgi:hypothetical protein
MLRETLIRSPLDTRRHWNAASMSPDVLAAQLDSHLTSRIPAAQRARVAVASTVPFQPNRTTPALDRARHHLRDCINAVLKRYDELRAA